MPRKGWVPPPSYDSHAARTARRAADRERPTRFIGCDGEGWTDHRGVHRYAQLSVGERTLFGHEHLDFLQIVEFLWDCFLDDPKAAYVGFYLGYDFSQWFRTLPEDRARVLFDSGSRRRVLSGGNTVPFPVRYKGWEFDTLGDKRFKLREEGTAQPWMYVCDTGPFFQCSFLKVIDPKEWPDGAVCSDAEYGVVLEGKSHRADDWTADTWMAARDDLTRYNVTENLLLSRVMERYEQGLLGCGVRLKRDQWYGPGAASQAWMGNEGVSSREQIEVAVPADVLEFGRESYYGGWFEVFAHGHIPGTSTELDVNSAYPAAMAIMPDWTTCEYRWLELGPAQVVEYRVPAIPSPLTLVAAEAVCQSTKRAGEVETSLSSVPECTASALSSLFRSWDRAVFAGELIRASGSGQLITTTPPENSAESSALLATLVSECSRTIPNSYAELHGTWKGDDLWLIDVTTVGTDPVVGSMLHRRKDGTILRPHKTRGIRWAHEVRAGIAAGIVEHVTLHRVLTIRPHGGHVLNAAVPAIYQKRLDVGKNTAHGKAFKLIYNSAYGKQAQSVGSPKFSNALSASFITSHCRTTILHAIATHPGGTSSLLMVATDGVYFRTPHPGLDIDKGRLGAWDHSTKENMTIVMPGVYYDDASRDSVRSGGFAKLKSRGIPAAAFAAAIGKLDAGFSKLAEDPTRKEHWPTLDVPIKFQVQSPRLALHQGKWGSAGTVQRDVDRKLSTDPSSKRVGPGSQGVFMLFEDLEPYLDGGIIRTRPYQEGPTLVSQPYEKRFGMDDQRDLGVSPDGPVAQELFDLMGDR